MCLTEISNFAVAIATGGLAYMTYLTNNRMKEQFDSMNRAYVRASVKITGSSAISLQITNEGNMPAENLTMRLDREFFLNAEKGGRSLNSATAFSREIKAMPGKTTWNYFIGVGERLLNPNLGPQEFAITVKYQSGGKTFEETLNVDLGAWHGTGSVSVSDPSTQALQSLASSAKEICNAINAKSTTAAD